MAEPIGEGGAGTLEDFVGLKFLNYETGVMGILSKFPIQAGGVDVYYLDFPGTAGAGQPGGQRLMPGALIIDPRTRQSLTVGRSGAYTSQKLTDSDINRLFGGGGYGTSGAAAPAWRPGELELETKALEQRLQELQTQIDADIAAAEANHTRAIELLERELASASALQKERIQHEIDLENLRHDNNMKQLQLQLTAERKNLLVSEIGASGRTMMEQQGAMGRELLQLGPDPFKQAAGLRGQATRGVTPQTQAVGQAEAFMNQPIPQANFGMDIPQLQAMLSGMQGTQAPSAGGLGMAGPIGMAGGGVVKGGKQTVLVGDAAGIIPGLTEVVTGSDFQVTPLAGTAQFGWPERTAAPTLGQLPRRPPGGTDIGRPVPPSVALPPTGGTDILWPQPIPGPTPGAQAILQQLAPLYAGSVFGQVPTLAGQGYALGEPTAAMSLGQAGGLSPMGMLSELGVTPQLIRTGTAAGERHTYYIQNGKRFYIPGGGDPDTLIELGLDPSQVVEVTPAAINRFPPGGTFTGQGAQAPGAVQSQGGFGAMGVPIVEPVSGALLPAPHKIAGLWNQLSLAEQGNIVSAYSSAGISPQILQSIIQAATPMGVGTGRRIGGIGMQR